MEHAYGKLGFSVSALGFGAGHIGDPSLEEAKAGYLLNQVLDIGTESIDQGTFPVERFEFLRQTFRQHDDNWISQV